MATTSTIHIIHDQATTESKTDTMDIPSPPLKLVVTFDLDESSLDMGDETRKTITKQ